MRLNCPTCSMTLEVPEKSLGKLIHCPACKQSFVANPALANAPKRKNDAPVARGPITENDYVLPGGADDVAQDATATTPKFCPNCGKPWSMQKGQCKFCRYDLLLRRVAMRERRFTLPKIDVQQLYIFAALIAVGVVAYYVYQNWNAIYASVDSIWRR